MTHSMTAFARQESSTESYVLVWEMRSVNHRYLEINIRVPDSLRSIENSIRGAIRSNFTRGKIECHLRYQITENSSSSIKIDTQLVSHLLSATEQIKILSEETSPLGMSEILKWPGVIIDNDSTESYVLVWEMRSVNHRYLEINIRVPDSLRSIENSIRGAIRSNFTRGKIECHLRYQITENSSSSIKIDTQLVSHLLSATEQIKILSEETSPLGMSEILKWPGVIIDNDSDSLALESDAISLFKKTMEDLKTSRAREGKELGSFIQARSHSVLEIIAKTRELMPQILTRERNQLLEKISKLKIDVDSSRLEAEIVLLTQKADIEEAVSYTHLTLPTNREV